MKNYILERAKEASTWRGICLFLTAVGVPIAPELADAIIATGIAVAGLVGIITPDKA
jgi:hypothetical protein